MRSVQQSTQPFEDRQATRGHELINMRLHFFKVYQLAASNIRHAPRKNAFIVLPTILTEKNFFFEEGKSLFERNGVPRQQPLVNRSTVCLSVFECKRQSPVPTWGQGEPLYDGTTTPSNKVLKGNSCLRG
ncbi:hypothetical protein TNCT_545961 [Trichonephila clavata]|uniref:Uncharacterized protein n=1 Tax=Trichonephila clavata TaxID=2740835 RepID=A0A8X6HFI1_TRICU|nr:hypothetical protein TNCT_545961 [Trichonephila clavata]